jgi:hypothetical protein
LYLPEREREAVLEQRKHCAVGDKRSRHGYKLARHHREVDGKGSAAEVNAEARCSCAPALPAVGIQSLHSQWDTLTR